MKSAEVRRVMKSSQLNVFDCPVPSPFCLFCCLRDIITFRSIFAEPYPFGKIT